MALHYLGIPTSLICKVGADPFGQIVRDLLESHGSGLSRGIIVDAQVSTSYSVILSPPGVDRIILNNPAANHTFNADDIDYELVNQTALFHFGYPPIMRRMYEHNGEGLVELFRRIKQTGVTTSLDMYFPDPAAEGGHADWAAILKATLPYVDIFLPSIEELLLMLGKVDAETMARRGSILDQVSASLLHDLGDELLDMGVRLAVIKLGERGLYLPTAGQKVLEKMGRARPATLDAWAEKEFWAPCFRAHVVGTTGSGDATIAGFLSALLRNLNPEEAVTIAVAVGACNVEAADALSGLLTWDATLQRIQTGWERLPLHLDDPTWTWEESFRLWKNISNNSRRNSF
jgi:sugar/nucleoside kinase (ribokinase family)